MDLAQLSEGEVVLQFIRVRQAWYTQAEIIGQDERERMYGQEEFGFYAKRVVNGELMPEGSEFFVRWRRVADKDVPRAEVFNDAWGILPYFSHMLSNLNDRDMSGDEFQAELLDAGLMDVTERKPLSTRDQETYNACQKAQEQRGPLRRSKP